MEEIIERLDEEKAELQSKLEDALLDKESLEEKVI